MNYEAEFEDEEMEIFEAETEIEAIEEAWELSGIHGRLFGLYLLDENYKQVKSIL